MWRLLAEYPDEYSREEETDKATNDNFTRAVTNTLLEAGELARRELQGLDKRIQITPLIAEVHAKPDRVVDDEKGNGDRDRESTGSDTLVVTDRGEERDCEGSVGARHVAVGGDVFEFPAVLHAVHDELHDLRDDTHDNRDEEDGVFLKKLVGYHVASISPGSVIGRVQAAFRCSGFCYNQATEIL